MEVKLKTIPRELSNHILLPSSLVELEGIMEEQSLITANIPIILYIETSVPFIAM
jgi:hypothetical protein